MTEQNVQNDGLTADEVEMLRRAAVLAGATVAVARFSGEGGTRAEFNAIIDGLELAAERVPGNVLVQALLGGNTRAEVADLAAQFQNGAATQRDYADLEMSALNRCAQAGELLKVKAPPDRAAEVRAAVVSMCEHVARAGIEETTDGTATARVTIRETNAVNSVRRALEGE